MICHIQLNDRAQKKIYDRIIHLESPFYSMVPVSIIVVSLERVNHVYDLSGAEPACIKIKMPV